MSEVITLDYRSIGDSNQTVAVLALNRPQSANAFNAQMISEITTAVNSVTQTRECRALIVRGIGKNFCAGADLHWMKDSVDLTYEQNVSDAAALTQMFEALYKLKLPSIVITQGAVYGGAVGLVSACDIAIAQSNSRFCLSEVRVGLIPAVIMPYVARKLLPGQLRRHSLSGRVFTAKEALQYGLVEICCSSDELDQVLVAEVNGLLAASPTAQHKLKALHQNLVVNSLQQSSLTQEAIAEIRTSPSGQAGLKAFISKSKPNWIASLPKDWTLDG